MQYDEIKKVFFEILPNAMDIIIGKLPKDTTSLWAIGIASVSIIISIALPVITYFIHKKLSAGQLRVLIIAYIKAFENKIEKIINDDKWGKENSFEDYNKKNYEILESFLPQIYVLNRNERNVFINFVIKFKTSDEMNLETNIEPIKKFRDDLLEVKSIIIKNLPKKRT